MVIAAHDEMAFGAIRALRELGFRVPADVQVCGFDDVQEAAEVFRLMLEEVEALDIDQPFLYSSHPRLEERIQTLTELSLGHVGSNGVKEVERFQKFTGDLKGVVLQRYLQQQDYKRLMLILEDPSRRSLYPDHARFYLGEAYRLRNEKGDLEKAKQAYVTSTQEAPLYAPNYRALGILAMKAKQSAEAIEYFEHYLRLTLPGEGNAYVESYLKKLKD